MFDFMSYLYILDINTISFMSLANIFSQVGCLFVLLMVFFDV